MIRTFITNHGGNILTAVTKLPDVERGTRGKISLTSQKCRAINRRIKLFFKERTFVPFFFLPGEKMYFFLFPKQFRKVI
jgi:hypothetical protein